MHFLDRDIGWVVSWSPESGGVLLQRTRDGGSHWSPSVVPDPYPDGVGTVSVEAVDADTVWVQVEAVHGSAFSIGGLYASHDGGATWLSGISTPGGWPVRFISPSDGWTFAGPLGDHLQVTRDGGRTWREVSIALPPGHEQDDARSFDLPTFTAAAGLPEIGVLPMTLWSPPDPNTSQVTATLALYTSDDLGATWRFASTVGRTTDVGQGMTIASMIFSGQVWLVASDPSSGALTFTKDAGTRWDDIGSTGLAGVARLRFADEAHGWALTQSNGAGYGLSATTDGGRVWRPLDPRAKPPDAASPSSSASVGPYRWTSVSVGTELSTYAIGQAIRRSDGTYLAIGTGQEVRILRSADGRTWTVEPGDAGLLAAPASHIALVNGVAEGPGSLVAVGAMALDDISSGDARAWTSTDGVTWHAADVSGATDAAMGAVAAGPRGFVAVGSDGFPGGNVQLPGANGAAVWTSPDGSHWIRVADQPDFSRAVMTGVRRTATGYVAWGQTLVGQPGPPPPPVWTSSDGVHWDRATGGTDSGGPGSPIASVVEIGGRLVAVGTHEIAVGDGSANVPGAWISDDGGRTWNVSPVEDDIAAVGGAGGAFDIAPVGSGLVAVGYADAHDGAASAATWWSPDRGATWTRLGGDPTFAGADLRHILGIGSGFLTFGQSDGPGYTGPTTNLIWLVEPSAP